jgi:hypothetical protein
MRIEEVKVYKFEELDDKAKEVARKWWFRRPQRYIKWYGGVFDWFIKECKQYGINIGHKNIQFSGFWLPGSGASFDCADIDADKFLSYANINIKHGLKNVFINHLKLYIDRNSSRYCHENSVDAYADYFCVRQERNRIDSYLDSVANELENKLEELKNRLCTDLYRKLEKEYDFAMLDEPTDETIIRNEYEFYADGTKY